MGALPWRPVARTATSWAFYLVAGKELCLPDGIPESNWRNIQEEDLESVGLRETAIRMVLYDWISAEVVSELTGILLSEVLGYNVTINTERATESVAGSLQLAGCVSQDCSERQPRSHVAMDSWLWGTPGEFANLETTRPSLAPRRLGSMGWTGQESLYVKGSVREEAYHTGGLALDFYRSYNTSQHQAAKFFSRVADLDTAQFVPCNSSNYESTSDYQMRTYAEVTGDTDGVVETPTGYIAKCPDDYFWRSPACRHNTSECIPVIAAGFGWNYYVWMQWSTWFSMPTAIGIAKEGHWESVVENFETVFYWWYPDATFLHLDAWIVAMPRHSRREWAVDFYRTGFPEVIVEKLVSSHLPVLAPRVSRFLEKFLMDLEDILGLLLEVHEGATPWAAACNWVRLNRRLWMEWIPVDTQCLPGEGLQSSLKEYVTNRSDAVGCSTCRPGSFSKSVVDGTGATFVCEPCPAGTFESAFGQTACVDCDSGTFTNSSGRAHCDYCDLGRYANASGMTSCHACGSEHWTTSQLVVSDGVETWVQVKGVTSGSFCTCVAGWFLNQQGVCERCIRMVYRCFGRASRCSGGPPGSCASGRDPGTITCSECLPGRMPLQDGSCGPCVATSYAAFGLVVLALVFCIALVYVVLALQADRATQPGHLFVGIVALSQLVTLIQQLLVVSKLDIEWHEPMNEILKGLAVLGVDLDMIAFSCLATVSPVLKYVLSVSVTPILACIALVLHLLAVAFKKYVRQDLKVRLDAGQLLRTVGSLVSLLFIGIFTALVTPFQCNSHPNGRMTIQQYASVFCNLRDAHLQMSVIGAVACLMPLSFLAVCIWIIHLELPKRLLRADATYCRACSFLWLRFRPGGERFVIFMQVSCPANFES
ncbi:unnamed protein product [Symbiodinium sp. CCMP2592]|nr:unnamed protein product [Symbiodinium sp. CCMP2592]